MHASSFHDYFSQTADKNNEFWGEKKKLIFSRLWSFEVKLPLKKMFVKKDLVKAFHFFAALQFFYGLYYEVVHVLP